MKEKKKGSSDLIIRGMHEGQLLFALTRFHDAAVPLCGAATDQAPTLMAHWVPQYPREKGPLRSHPTETCLMGQWPNLPTNAGDVGSIPGRETKILHVMGPLGPHAQHTESTALDDRN